MLLRQFLQIWFIIGALGFCFPAEAQVPDFSKKIDKLLQKTYKSQEVYLLVSEDAKLKNIPNRTFYHIMGSSDELLGILTISKAYGCHIDGCDDPSALKKDFTNSTYEEFYYAIVFKPNLSIKVVKILEYDSEYGYEICSRRWLKQFRFKNPYELQINSNIDGISGATVSVNSLVNDIMNLELLIR